VILAIFYDTNSRKYCPICRPQALRNRGKSRLGQHILPPRTQPAQQDGRIRCGSYGYIMNGFIRRCGRSLLSYSRSQKSFPKFRKTLVQAGGAQKAAEYSQPTTKELLQIADLIGQMIRSATIKKSEFYRATGKGPVCGKCGGIMVLRTAEPQLRRWQIATFIDAEGHYWHCPGCHRQ
jgi:hypothetical protein